MRIIEKPKPPSKKIFINKLSRPLDAKLIKVTSTKDESGNKIKVYHYDVHLEINKKQAVEQDLQKIEINLIGNALSGIPARSSLFDNIDTSDPDSINMVATNALRIKFDQTQNLENNFKIFPIGQLSSDDVFLNKDLSKLKSSMLTNKPDKEIFGFKKRFTLTPENSTTAASKDNFKNYLSLPKKEKKENEDLSEKFKIKYSKLVNSGIDPAGVIAKAFSERPTQTMLGKTRGRFSSLGRIPKAGVHSVFNNALVNSVESTESDSSLASLEYRLDLVETPNIDAILTQRVTITQKQLLRYKSDQIHLAFIAKNSRNVKIEAGSGIIKHEKEKKKIRFPKFDFDIEANKTTSGQIMLSIKNNELHARTFNIYSRQLNNYLPQEMIEFELKLENVKVPARGKVSFFRKGNYFKKDRPTFFRVNPVFDQREYSNSKFTSVNTGRRLLNLKYAGISAIIQVDRIAIEVKNLSNEINKVELFRRNLTKKERNFTPTQSKSNAANGSIDLSRNKVKSSKGKNLNVIYTFYDDDIEFNHTYEYKAVLYDDSGNKYFSSNSAIEKYSKPTGYVTMIPKKTLIRLRDNSKEIEISGTVEKIQTDADRLFKDLFGRYYDLFEDDLKDIKDLSGISINILVEMINRDNSDVSRLGEISVDNQGNFSKLFKIPAQDSVAIKLTPRVLPPSEIFSKLSENLPNLAAKYRFAPVSAFNTAAIKTSLGNRGRGVLSVVGDKFSQRTARMSGKILDKKTKLSRTNFDTYYDGDTGDVVYLLEDGINKIDYESVQVEIENANIEYLDLDNIKKQENNLRNKSTKSEYYLASFDISNLKNGLDFLLMVYSENDQQNYSGLAFPSNSSTNIRYVFKTSMLYGKINFYAKPVLKNGQALSPILIKTIYKDDEGIK